MSSTRPSAFPPPFDASSVIAQPAAAPDDQLEVGVAIVGGGVAGLACAIRLGQLLEADPATAETLGEVPVAVIEKGRVLGAHQVSGAVVEPAVLRELLPGVTLAEMGSYGEVEGEAIYFLTSSRSLKLPIVPPPMRNHGNHIFSLSRLTRYLGERAEALGAMVLPETAAQRLLVADGAVVGVQTGDKGRGRDGEELAAFEPGAELVAQATVLAEGVQGMLTQAAIEHFELEPENPQIYALGVKEIWRVPKPLRRVIHTLGWPLRPGKRSHEFGGSFIYPMGDELLCLGLVVGLDSADASLSVHDLLQEFKLHPLVRPLLEGGERIGWGAKAIPEGGFFSLPASVSMPGAVVLGDAAGFVNVPTEGHRLRGAQRHAGSRVDLPRDLGGREPTRARGAAFLRRRGRLERDLRRPPPLPQHTPAVHKRARARRSARRCERRGLRRVPARADRDAPGRRAGAVRRQASLLRARREADVRQALERLPLGQPLAR